MRYALVRNFDSIVAVFPSKEQAEEAFADIGFWTDDPGPDDLFELLPLDDAARRQGGSRA